MKRFASILALLCLAALSLAGVAHASFGLREPDVSFLSQDGSEAIQAGAHPYALSTSFSLNTVEDPSLGYEIPDGDLKDLTVLQIPGLVGDPTAVPACATDSFLRSECSAAAQVGRIEVELVEPSGINAVPRYTEVDSVYRLSAPPGKVMRLGFHAGSGFVPVTVDLSLSESPPYEVVASLTDAPQVLGLFRSNLTLWGVPASPVHDSERSGKGCSAGGCSAGSAEEPLITLPRACRGPLATTFAADSWQQPGPPFLETSVPTHDDATPPNPLGFTGCSRLGFRPTISSHPTSKAASSASGLDFSLDVGGGGLADSAGLADSDIEKTVVTLPQGFTVNPAQAEGLATCSEADLAREGAFSSAGQGCPEASKIGTIEVESPLLEGALLKGGLFVATPYQNPFGSLIALYVTIREPKLGIFISQALEVQPDPRTGQLVTTARDMPQLPFSHFRLHFREGGRAPLITPPACGTFQTKALLYPYSGAAPVESSSSFELISGPSNSPCPPAGTPPFHPDLLAGTVNNRAGSFSPFDVSITRTDSEQEITHFSIKLPPGVAAKLAGVPPCPEAQIAQAASRTGPHGGQLELGYPSCPAASEIGHTLVGSGIGSSLTYVPGKLYLAGPYHGAPISVVAITSAVAGPFDLGTVVVREALRVNPETAEVFVDATGSDPIPHIIRGIPVHLRDIRVYTDRPEFVVNPTSCEPTSTASTVLGSGTNFASEADDNPITVSSPFQAADCASLGFKPKLALQVKGPTHRGGVPKFKATLTYPKGGPYANIAKSVLTLPFSEILEQGHIGTSCTRVQFNQGGGNGEHCPAASVYGRARAITPLLSEPLEGPVYLRSNGGERNLPDLVAALHGSEINIDLVGFIDAVQKKGAERSRIRNTFAAVPDAPVSKFTLEMDGGKRGLLVNTTNICRGANRAVSVFTGHNGKRYATKPKVVAKGCGKKGKGHRRHGKHQPRHR